MRGVMRKRLSRLFCHILCHDLVVKVHVISREPALSIAVETRCTRCDLFQWTGGNVPNA